MPPTIFWLNLIYHYGVDEVWKFSRWPHGGHLRYWTRTNFQQFWISMLLLCRKSSLGSIRITVWEEMSFEEFQDGLGGHHRCQYGKYLAVPILHISPVSPTKFQLNPTYRLGADVVPRFSRWPPWWTSWILERNEFSNSEYVGHLNASHQVYAQSDLPFGSRRGL